MLFVNFKRACLNILLFVNHSQEPSSKCREMCTLFWCEPCVLRQMEMVILKYNG